VLKSFKAIGNVLDFAWQFSFEMNFAFAVDDAKRTGPQRHIYSNIVFHSLSPSFTVIL
jgi:hypothetical protein